MGWRGAAVLGAVVVGTAAALVRFAVLVVHVDGASMRPSYEPGVVVIAIRRQLDRAAQPGDIVVVRVPSPDWHAVDPLAAAQVLVVKRVMDPPEQPGYPRLTPSELWVEGDGQNSYDSRRFGPVRRDAVVGRVLGRLRRARSPVNADRSPAAT